ncbi:hypothetical protein [Cellulophaga sp. BC115SP]|uniref:hypothetical protein n=1 Tax=Cellulophaga sp. BC115SP TaxID=2683263 RepID=UPI00141266E0|nr:hypothetical protein [Cellulophaga sp. BC115SP]NBB30618.1 hypothetical protein [Cellulophaga sp. BC115SP]
MNTSKNITLVKSITPSQLAQLDKVSQENYQLLKEDTEGFSDFDTLFSISTEAEETLDALIQTAEAVGIFQKQEKPKSTTSKTPSKKKATNTVDKRAQQKVEKQTLERDNLEKEVEELKATVISNSQFKEKIAAELRRFLKVSQTGLSGVLTKNQKELTLEEQIQILKGKRKFYKNLIKGDTSDFKAIALRVGLDFKKSQPKPKKQNLSGVPQTISGTKKNASLIDRFKHWWDN